MRDVVLLTEILLKNSYRSLEQPASKKAGKAGRKSWTGALSKRSVKTGLLYFWILVLLIPYAAFMYFQFGSLFEAGLGGMALQIGFVFCCFLSVFTLLFSFANIFYFSSDLSALLPLPVKPQAILTAKTVVVLIPEIPLVSMIALPLAIAAVTSQYCSIAAGIWVFLCALLCALSSALVMAILTMVLMKVMPVFANKDRFGMIIGLLSVLFAVFCSLIGQFLGQGAADDPSILIHMLQSNQGAISSLSGVFFQSLAAVDSIVHKSLLSGLLFVGECALILVLYFAAAKTLYLPVAVKIMGQAASRPSKKVSLRSSSPFAALAKNEWHMLMRTPAYMTNCVMSAFIMPLIFIIMTLFVPSMKELREIAAGYSLEDLALMMNWPAWALALAAGILAGLFFGSLNGIAGTAITREGKPGLMQIRSMPVSMKTFTASKMAVGMLIGWVSTLMLVPVFMMYLSISWSAILMYGLGTLAAVAASSAIALFIDCIHPKLIWDNETVAVKNNFNIVFDLLATWLLAGLTAWMLFGGLPIAMSAVVCLIILIAAAVGLLALIPSRIEKIQL